MGSRNSFQGSCSQGHPGVTDRGGEFTTIEFADYYDAESVHRQHTVPYSPQQNGIIEHQNGMVVAAPNSMLKGKGLPGWFWGEAVNTAVYVLNRCLTKSVDGMTPFEVWHGRKSTVHHLRTFGCIVCVWNTMPHLKELQNHGRKMIFVGYESDSKVYRAYDPITKHVHVTHDVVFDEQAQWDRGSGSDNSKSGSGNDIITMEYTTMGRAAPMANGRDEASIEESPLSVGAGDAEVDNNV
jgi:hypothetical protein